MSSDSVTLELGAGPARLLADRAVFLPGPGLLLVADAHFGKAHSFRRLGVPVPGGTTAANLDRLTRLIALTAPAELVFLGDLLHARHGRGEATLAAVQAWRARHAGLPMRLVRGNHDSRAGDPPPDWDIAVTDEPWRVGGWALCHEPQPVDGAYALAGHLHPCCHVGSGLDRLRLPCFHFGPAVGVLPAFGAFTGMHPVKREPGDRIALVAEGQVRLLKT